MTLALFNTVLATRSFPQLKITTKAYCRMANPGVLSSVRLQFSRNTESVLMVIFQCALNHTTFFAKRLYYFMEGTSIYDSTWSGSWLLKVRLIFK